MPLKVGVKVEPLVIVGVGPGPETNAQLWFATETSSVAPAPVGQAEAVISTELVGRVIDLSGPAQAVGATAALTVTVILSVAVSPPLSVTVRVKM